MGDATLPVPVIFLQGVYQTLSAIEYALDNKEPISPLIEKQVGSLATAIHTQLLDAGIDPDQITDQE